VEFDIQSALQLIVLSLAVLPAVQLIKFYRKTKLLDYLLFSLVFVFVIVAQSADFIRVLTVTEITIVKIADSAQLTIYLLLGIHALRTKWKNPPIIISGVIIIGYAYLEILILLFKPVTLINPDFVLWRVMFNDRNCDMNTFAILLPSGTIIMGHCFRFLFFIYRLFVQILFIYSYLTTKLAWDINTIAIAKNWWIIALSILAVNTMRLIGHSLGLWVTNYLISDLANVLALGIIGYVTIRYPEGILVSHAQVSNAASAGPINKKLTHFSLLLNPYRLAIMDLLYQHGSYQSAKIRKFLNISWGKFAPHIVKLEKAGFITSKDEFIDTKPRKVIYLESNGQIHYKEFQDTMLGMFSRG